MTSHDDEQIDTLGAFIGAPPKAAILAFSLLLMVLMAAFLGWICYGRLDVTLIAPGRMSVEKALVTVTAPAESEIVQILVAPGRFVQKQQEIALLKDRTTGSVSSLPAPVAGHVTSVLSKQGEVVKEGEPVAVILEPGSGFEVEVFVPTSYMPSVQAGMEVRIDFPGAHQGPQAKTLVAHLTRLGAVAQVGADGQHYVSAKAVFSEPPPDNLRIYGAPVSVQILLGERTLLDYLISPLVETGRLAMHEP